MTNHRSKKGILKDTAKLEKELAVKKHELDIEAALEKVRTVAMGMRKRDELSVIVGTIFEELKKLGFIDLRNAEIVINNNAKETITSYYYSDYGVTGVIELDYKSNKILKGWAEELKKASNAFAKVVIPEKEMKAWRKYRQEIGYLPDRKLNKAKTVYYYSYSTGLGALSISSFKPVSKEQIRILRRFRNVFQLSYQRYTDIAKAEAQTREAKIEAALERVRASSMAMHRSSELHKVIKEVTEQLMLLGFDFDTSNITTDLTPAGFYVWNASPATPIPSGVYIPYKDIYVINWIYSDWGVHEGIRTITFNKSQKDAFFKHYLTHTEGRYVPDERKKYILNAKGLNLTTACRKEFALDVINYRDIIYTDEQNKILERFAKVFEQSYTRFLDLQRAETHAREAEIEAALERVRSRTMAMHRTAELQDVIHVVHKELLNLNLSIDGGSFVVINDDVGPELRCWGSGGTANTSEEVRVPHFDMPFCTDLIKGIKKGPGFFTEEFSQQEKKDYFTQLFQRKPWSDLSSTQKKETLSSPGGYTRSVTVSKHTSVFIINHRGRKFTEDENDILKRFAKVFEQTYTRFLDLQKAEAQAREAQIELGLERVRAKAMAMHSTADLAEAVNIFFKELKTLEISPMRCGIGEVDEKKQSSSLVYTTADKQGELLEVLGTLKHEGHPVIVEIFQHWKSQEEYHPVLQGSGIREYYKAIRSQVSVPEFARHEKHYGNYFYFREGFLFTWAEKELSEEGLRIARKFTSVLSLTYRRYRDLKEAEAQARESQIQLALERVRARTMAMQKSTELPEAAKELFQQVQSLGMPSWAAGYCIWEDDKNAITAWMHTEGAMQPPMKYPTTGEKLFIEMTKGYESGKALHVVEMGGDGLAAHYRYMYTLPGVAEMFDSIAAAGHPLPTFQVMHYAYFSKGFLMFITYEHVPEAHYIFKRFASVFDQTYTRFLDLQKAEAQAREAEIQLALERIRARTMAMQRSDELLDVITIFSEQLANLKIHFDNVSFGVNIHGDDFKFWLSALGAPRPIMVHVPYIDNPAANRVRAAQQEGLKFFADILTKKENEHWINHLIEHSEIKDYPHKVKEFLLNSPGFARSAFILKNINLYVGNYRAVPYTEEENNIFQRFSHAFEQSYTRFLDLQKAEAQAREARIEAALEKVRSRSLAMHKAEELGEVAAVVFEKLRELDLPIKDGVAIVTHVEGSKDQVEWMESPGYPSAIKVYQPYYEHPILADYWKAKTEGLDFIAPKYTAEQSRSFLNHIFEFTDYKHTPREVKDYCLAAETYSYFAAFQKNSSIFINDYSGRTLSEPEIDIVKRFSKVFEQAYVRFLDLQKAEAQAREAQIEAALERVRSRTMAMQKSEEIADIVGKIFTELRLLDLVLNRVLIWIFNDEEGYISWWSANPEVDSNAESYRVDYNDQPVFLSYLQAWQKRTPLHLFALAGEAKKKWEDHLFSNTEMAKLPAAVREGMRGEGTIFTTSTISDYGLMMVGSFEPLSDENVDIIQRFGRVFQQSYTRYLDVQTAEAQARESQIQLALERVRARTMGMQRSEELSETAFVLFQQLVALGEDPIQITIGIMNEEERSMEFRVTDWGGGGSKVSTGFHVSVDEPTLIGKVYEAWKRNDRSTVIDLAGPDLEGWLQYRNRVSGVQVKSTDTRGRRVISVAFFSKGMIAFSTPLPRPQESILLLERFAAVFDLTYTRFLDLQKAELQAREAQIELGLERVRAKAMAMQSSEELNPLIGTVFTELTRLDLVLTRCVILIYEGKQKGVRWWMANSETPSTPMNFFVKYADMPFFNEYFNGWRNKTLKWQYILEGENKVKTDDFLFKDTELSQLPDFVIGGMRAPDLVYLNASFNNFGNLTLASLEPLSEEHFNILLRFAKVFDLTYTRFNDLKQAEAQAKESQIQLALERVRARTMAMHKSVELAETAQVMFQQLLELGSVPDRIAIGVVDEPAGVVNFWSTDQSGSHVDRSFEARLNERTVMSKAYRAWKDEKKSLAIDLHGDDLKEWLQFVRAEMKVIVRDEFIKDRRVHNFAFFSHGWLLVTTHEPQPMETIQILERFASVFNLTYRRFLDLQKAEAQAREAHIEAALERVRSRSLAMHKSDELSAIARTMFDQLRSLGLELEDGLMIMLFREGSHDQLHWPVFEGIETDDTMFRVPYFDHPVMNEVYKAREAGVKFIEKHFNKTIKDDFLKKIFSITDYKVVPVEFQQKNFEGSCYHYSFAMEKFTGILMHSYNRESYPAEYNDILKRFARVFEQAYVRFLDLQKAEAQAREAQIEAALERVRAKAMAMHSSQDLVETIKVFYKQLDTLNLMPRRCGVGLIDKETRIAELIGMVINDQGEAKEISGKLTLADHPVLENVYDCWVGQKDYYPVLRGNEIKEYYQLIGAQISIQNYPDDAVQFGYFFSFPEGQVYAWTDKEFTEDELKIYRRFTSVLSLTYKRYKDLKQAEAQAREAQIEAGLERVRARTMAMHSSEDVSAATATMFVELEKLGIENFRGGITNIFDNRTQEVWSVNNLAEGKVLKAVGAFNIDAHPFWQLMFKEWAEKKDFIHYFLAGHEKDEYVKILNATQGYLPQAIQQFPDVHFQVYYFNEGGIWTNSLQPHSDEDKQVMKRFTSVFSLTFRRYQDLKKAEAQAREATIEAALEKVRGKAMAMHNSNDLSITSSMVFTELRKLGINPIRCGVGLLNNESLKAPLYSATSSEDGDHLSLVGWVRLEGHPVLEKIYDAWLKGEDYFPELQGEQLRSYYEQLLTGLSVPVPDLTDEQIQYGHFIAFKVGCLYAWSDHHYNEDEIKILKRFATIIDLTFRRYMELQQSEANAREAVKQAALDRVRADIASMRTIADLDRITPLIWNELTVLGLPFIRCGVFIMDETQRLIHTFLSSPDGKAIGAFHLPYDTPGHFPVMLKHWHEKKIYLSHWSEPDFMGIAETLVKQGSIATKEQYLSAIPHSGVYLHCLPFLQGMLYVGNTEQLNDEQIELIQHVADAFSTAYARYEDFNKLEAAKQQVEKTLVDLKQAQTQLVQSEKMASLGELTAGIAHEIQNPLNFVNNFSDVSNELLEEMKDELAKGNIDDAIAIAEDVKQNLEKINHHGKRADGIVKGMLQHSRTSSGQKELTDINVLADEYLRLAYHGLRAKDKSFNAKFETDFDSSVGKIDIIPQEIGRGILNLINNAFYAVSEKKKMRAVSLPPGQPGYEPLVTVRTKRLNDHIEIIVEDNGNGISPKILDKIFQPFFTTKPTGQGTGLGLSLAYDIIKAHGGDIKVKAKEGEGTKFIVQLPNYSS